MAEAGLGCKRSRVQISAARPAFSIFHASKRADTMSANEAVSEGLGNRRSVPSFPSGDDPQSWNLFAYGRDNPMLVTDPDGREACGEVDTKTGKVVPCPPQPLVNVGKIAFVLVVDKQKELSTIADIVLRGLASASTTQLQLGAQVYDWASAPRNPWCLAGSTASGAGAGAAVGALGVAGGPVVFASEPGGFLIGGATGWVTGMNLCRSSSGSGGGGGQSGHVKGGNKAIADAAREEGVDPKKFGKFIEAEKRAEGRGPTENYTYDELKALAQEFKAQGH